MAAEMRAPGFEVTEHVGKTGLVAIYKNGDGPTIMVRTELDALPMEEKTGLAYASHDKSIWQGRETFVAHCGHDIHMASWVGTAKTLVGLKDQRHRTLMFIAQPAEEIASGAKAILADGLFTGFPKPDFGFALHANGAFAYGTVLYHVGIGSSNANGLYIKFRGREGRGAVPQATIAPMMMAACFVVDVQHRTNETSKRPETIPGIGIIGASAIAATVFRSGRDFAAWIGRQDSTGGKKKLGPVSKQGDRYLPHAVLRRAKEHPEKYAWLTRPLARRRFKVGVVALANKMARIAWALMAQGHLSNAQACGRCLKGVAYLLGLDAMRVVRDAGNPGVGNAGPVGLDAGNARKRGLDRFVMSLPKYG